MMNISNLSASYTVTLLTKKDIPILLSLCEGNPQYYKYCPPAVTREGLLSDLKALPKGKTLADKYYVGFWEDSSLIAVMDLILQYPDDQTAFIGFFMMEHARQGKGIGSLIIDEVCAFLKKHFSFVRLGYVKDNPQSKAFWLKNAFLPTGTVVSADAYDIVIMQRSL